MNIIIGVPKKIVLCVIMLIPIVTFAAYYDSLNVRFVGNWPLGQVKVIAVDSLRNLVLCGSGGMVIIYDITNPAQPVKISDFIRTRGFVRELFFDQTTMNLYVAAGEDGLAIWNILDPAHPSLIGKYRPASRVYGVTKSDRHAYVTLSTGGLIILDVNDPSQPWEVGRYNSWGETHGVQVLGHYAYVADALLGLRVIDVANPTEPVQVGFFNNGYGATDLAVQGAYVYLAGGEKGLRIIDISDPTIPRQRGIIDSASNVSDVAIRDTLVYITDGILRVINVRNPTTPFEVGSLGFEYINYGLCLFGNCLLIADNVQMCVVDITDPTIPAQTGCQWLGYDAEGIDIVENYAYLAYNSADFHILDISDPTCPVEVGSCETGSWPWRVFVSGSYAYTAEWIDGMCIIDVSDPTHPDPVGRCNTPGLIWDIFVAGNYAYLADDFGALRIVKITDPTEPVEVGVCNIPGGALWGVMVVDSFAYCTDIFGYLWIINVSDPTQPTITGALPISHSPADCSVIGQTAYVACNISFVTADISDPTTPYILGQCNNQPTHVYSVDVAGPFAYTGNDDKGLRVIDISNPTLPVEVGYMSSISTAYDVHACGSYIYVIEGWAGLQIYQNTLMSVDEDQNVQKINFGFQLLGNPIRTGVLKVKIELQKPMAFGFNLYDIDGRIARTFPARNIEAGNKILNLDVRGLAAGIYFLHSSNLPDRPSYKVVIVE